MIPLLRFESRGDSFGAFGVFRLAIFASVDCGDSSTFFDVDVELTVLTGVDRTDLTGVEELDLTGVLTGVDGVDLATVEEFDLTGVSAVDLTTFDEFDRTGVANALTFFVAAEPLLFGVLGDLGVFRVFGEKLFSCSTVLGVRGDMGPCFGIWHVRGGELKL